MIKCPAKGVVGGDVFDECREAYEVGAEAGVGVDLDYVEHPRRVSLSCWWHQELLL